MKEREKEKSKRKNKEKITEWSPRLVRLVFCLYLRSLSYFPFFPTKELCNSPRLITLCSLRCCSAVGIFAAKYVKYGLLRCGMTNASICDSAGSWRIIRKNRNLSSFCFNLNFRSFGVNALIDNSFSKLRNKTRRLRWVGYVEPHTKMHYWKRRIDNCPRHSKCPYFTGWNCFDWRHSKRTIK